MRSNSAVDICSFGLVTGDSWGVDFGDDGKLIGSSACKVAGGAVPDSGTGGVGSLATGTTCYCWLTGYKPTAGLKTRRSMSSLAVPFHDLSSNSNCVAKCPQVCAAFIANSSESAIFTSLLVIFLFSHDSTHFFSSKS